jgi:hypothetical protein
MNYKDKWKINPSQIENLFEGAQSIARRFVVTNFRKEGFQDGGINPWAKKKRPDGRKVLVGKSNPHMFQSFQFDKLNKKEVRIVNRKGYSGYHNEGTSKLPTRRMIGESKTLDKMITNDIERRMKKVFKK